MSGLDERAAVLHYLRAQRRSVLAIVDGLDDQQMNTSVVASGWTPAGLLRHLGDAERHWFQEVLAGQVDPHDRRCPTTPRAHRLSATTANRSSTPTGSSRHATSTSHLPAA